MWGDNLVDQINDNNMSEGGQMYVQAQFATGLANSQTAIKSAWMGTPNVVVDNGNNKHSDVIDWSSGWPIPKNNEYFNSYFILAVINYVAGAEKDQSGDGLQKAEAARSTWSNLLNATSSETDLQTSPFNTMVQDAQGDINNTQSAMQSFGSLTNVVGDLAGLAGQLTVN